MARVNEDIQRIRAAKEALGLDFISDTRLTFVSEEISNLKEAWNAVVPSAEKLAGVRALLLKVSDALIVSH